MMPIEKKTPLFLSIRLYNEIGEGRRGEKREFGDLRWDGMWGGERVRNRGRMGNEHPMKDMYMLMDIFFSFFLGVERHLYDIHGLGDPAPLTRGGGGGR